MEKQKHLEAVTIRRTYGRNKFVIRLLAALVAAGCEPRPTKLVKAFNLRHPSESVTIQAARKWLRGEAYPSEPRLLALADWLAVDAAWLRFGETGSRPTPLIVEGISDALVRDFSLLTDEERVLMRQMLDLIIAGRALRGC